jgi:hypothetical protein
VWGVASGQSSPQVPVCSPQRRHFGVQPIRQSWGPPRKRPGKLHADQAYDHRRCRRALTRRHIEPRIARRGRRRHELPDRRLSPPPRLSCRLPCPASPIRSGGGQTGAPRLSGGSARLSQLPEPMIAIDRQSAYSLIQFDFFKGGFLAMFLICSEASDETVFTTGSEPLSREA